MVFLVQDAKTDDISQNGSAEILGAEIQQALGGMFEAIQPVNIARSEDIDFIGNNAAGCVDVGIELTDTVYFEDPNSSAMAASQFEVTNCGEVAALIYLNFTVAIDFQTALDTAYVIPPVTVWLGPGDSFISSCQFPVPPFEGSITVCVMAKAGDAMDFDCDTIVVTGSGSPGIPFSGCGVLINTLNCLLFAMDYGTDGPYYPEDTIWSMFLILDDYGSFNAGDSVFVSGTLYMTGDSACPAATGKLESNTIDSCGAPLPVPYEACGLLFQGAECVLFMSLDMDSLILVLDNYGQFDVGDTVLVNGTLDLNCDSYCMQGDGCLINNQIDSCGGSPPPVPFEGCGFLIPFDSCIAFAPLDDIYYP